MVRTHYGEKATANRDNVYRAANALGDWLGLHGGWMDIANMQRDENIEEFRRILREAA